MSWTWSRGQEVSVMKDFVADGCADLFILPMAKSAESEVF